MITKQIALNAAYAAFGMGFTAVFVDKSELWLSAIVCAGAFVVYCVLDIRRARRGGRT